MLRVFRDADRMFYKGSIVYFDQHPKLPLVVYKSPAVNCPLTNCRSELQVIVPVQGQV